MQEPKDVTNLQNYQATIDGKKVDFKWDPVKKVLLKPDGSLYTGTIPWTDKTATYKNGKEVSDDQETTSKKDTLTKTPIASPGGGFTDSQNAARLAGAATTNREADALNAAATADLTLSETLFKNIPSLNAILKKYVNTPGMTSAALLKEIRNDLWYKQNSQEIKERYVQYFNYRDLQALGQATGSTDYEMQIAKIEAKLKKRAATLGSGAASDPAALRKAAENLYITNRSEDESFITDFLAASIRPTSGMIGGKVTEGYSGDALATSYGSS